MKSTLLPASKLSMVASASIVPVAYRVVIWPLKRGRWQRSCVSMLRATIQEAHRQGGRARQVTGSSRLRRGSKDAGTAERRVSSTASLPGPASTAASAAASSRGACRERSPSGGRVALGRCIREGGGGLGEAEDGWVQGCTQVQQFARSFLLFLRRLRSYSIAGGSAAVAAHQRAHRRQKGAGPLRVLSECQHNEKVSQSWEVATAFRIEF